jgi:methyl-accepting chemotaxis protein
MTKIEPLQAIEHQSNLQQEMNARMQEMAQGEHHNARADVERLLQSLRLMKNRRAHHELQELSLDERGHCTPASQMTMLIRE